MGEYGNVSSRQAPWETFYAGGVNWLTGHVIVISLRSIGWATLLPFCCSSNDDNTIREFQIKVTLLITIFLPLRKLRPNVVLPQSEGNEEAAPFEKNYGDFVEQCFWSDFHKKRQKHFLWQCEWFFSSQITIRYCNISRVAHVEKSLGEQ